MKNNSLIQTLGCVVLAGFCLVAQRASALPFIDTMNGYALGKLAGQVNPEANVWASTGTNATGVADITVTNIPLQYPGLECPGTNSFYFGGGSGYTDRVGVHPLTGTNVFVVSSGTIYYSFVLSLSNVLLMTSGGGFVCAFNTLTGPQGTQPTVGGARLYMRLASDNTGYNVGIGKNPATLSAVTWATNEFQPGDTNFLVGSYTFVDGGTSNDFAQLWVNPSPTNFGIVAPPTPDVTNNSGADLQSGGVNQIESFFFRQGNLAVPLLLVSNFRLGYCWACVTPPTNSAAYPPAVLSVTQPATNTAVISWSTNNPCFQLQTSSNLTGASSNWTMLNGVFGLTTNTNAFLFTNSVASSTNIITTKFYRLKGVLN